MNATEFRIQFTVTCELLLLEGQSLDDQVEKIRTRIKEQVSGHRTQERLANYTEVNFARIINEFPSLV